VKQPQALPHLLWVYPGALAHALDAATWIETTRELRQLGWRVTLVAAGPNGYQQIRGIEVLCISRPEIYFLRQVVFHGRLWIMILRQWSTEDVILFHQMSALWLLPLRAVRCLMGSQRPLLVMDIRSLFMPSKRGFKDRLRQIFVRLMSRIANILVDGYLVITKRMAESLCISSDRLWGVWPSGVTLGGFASAMAARRWPLPGEFTNLIYIGALHYERNLLILSQAVIQANSEGMAFRLTLVGDGTARQDLEKIAAQWKPQICLIPPVPYDQIPEVLAQAHIGVLPFPDEEKFRVSSPIKLFEYMAAGLPILATRISCHTDVIGRGEFVFWAEQADMGGLIETLRMISQDKDGLSKMGAQAALAAREWTWRESAKKLRTALERNMRPLQQG
jgi:glycosyltransferase involved in cell wall biosynthesis